MKTSSYMTRALRSKDQRYALVLGKLGHVAPLASGVKPDALDHDRDGRKGGSKNPVQTDDLAALRAEYFEAVGKRPFHGWDAQTLRAKIAEAKG